MRPSALVYLEGDLDAQRLLEAWHLVGEGVDSVGRVLEDPELAERWSGVSGVDASEVPRVARILWAHGILLPEGECAQEALAYVRGRLARDVQAGRGRRR